MQIKNMLLASLSWLPASKADLENTKDTIMSKLSGLAEQVAGVSTVLIDVSDQLDKATAEIIGSLADVEIPAAAQEKLDALKDLSAKLKTASQTLDNITPDAPPIPAPVENTGTGTGPT